MSLVVQDALMKKLVAESDGWWEAQIFMALFNMLLKVQII